LNQDAALGLENPSACSSVSTHSLSRVTLAIDPIRHQPVQLSFQGAIVDGSHSQSFIQFSGFSIFLLAAFNVSKVLILALS
jgi:hypothetical protein